MNQQEKELLLWEYIDGVCNEVTHAYVKEMIATDEQWQNLYKELQALHQSIPNHIEAEEPSMRFTKNVMEAVADIHIAPATRTYASPAVIRLIGAFFIFTLVALLVYAVTITDWVRATENSPSVFQLAFNNRIFNMVGWVNVVVGLLLVDSLLRKSKIRKPLQS